MLKENFCGVLKDHYPNLYSIKKIIHILSKEDGDTSKLMNTMDSYIASIFDLNLKEISEICQKFLQVEIINKQVED
jgi:sialic acid synthase SpsE